MSSSNVLVGTSGYVFDDWVGSFYPPKLPRKDWLRFYASQFDLVEVNATYYRIPPPKIFEGMALKTSPKFKFIIKANQEMTHHSSRDRSLYELFCESIHPLVERNRCDGILLQFPYGFKNSPANQDHLRFLSDAFCGHNVWAEFRHRSWNGDGTKELLLKLELGYCAVDEPSLPGLMPASSYVTSNKGYVRFHGRNSHEWWGGGHRRYDWEYTTEELESWLEKIREMSEVTTTTYVFFNNCYMGRAIKGARLMQRLLGQNVPLELEF